MTINFKEIPEANKGGGDQDTFELFAREFLHELGMKIIEDPSRGADGGKDLVVEESRPGITGESVVRWLVSCKHFAHSGRAVSTTDEPSIKDRVGQHSCDAFMGFYSTLPSSGLSERLASYQDIESYLYDSKKLERILLSSQPWFALAERFFPESTRNYQRENPQPADILPEQAEILCECCKKNLLEKREGVIGFLTTRNEAGGSDTPIFHKIYFACRGDCDYLLQSAYRKYGFLHCGWNSIRNFTIPSIYLDNMMAFATGLRNNQYQGEAFETMKSFFHKMFPFISRELTSKEKEEIPGIRFASHF